MTSHIDKKNVTISQEPFTPKHESETTASSSSLSKAAVASINIPSNPHISSLSDSDIQNADVKMKLLTGTWKDAHNFPFPVWFIYFFIGPFFISFQRKERHKRKLFIGSHSMTIRTKQSSDKNEFKEC